MNTDNEIIEYRDFDAWAKYARESHTNALQVIQWMAPMVVGLSNRAEHAREKLGEEEYGELPHSDGNPLYWIAVDKKQPKMDKSGRWSRGLLLETVDSKEDREENTQAGWAALSDLSDKMPDSKKPKLSRRRLNGLRDITEIDDELSEE